MSLYDAITKMNKLHKESTRVFLVLGIIWGVGTFGFTQHKVREFELHDIGEEFESEDHLSGTYKGVHFEQADVHSWTQENINSEMNVGDSVEATYDSIEEEKPKPYTGGLKLKM